VKRSGEYDVSIFTFEKELVAGAFCKGAVEERREEEYKL